MAIRPLAGYPCANEKGGLDWIGDIDGPASYANSGTFATSGQQLNAIDLGFGGFELVDAPALSSDGVNEVLLVMGATVAGATSLSPSPGAGQSGPAVSSVVFHWYTGIRGITGSTPSEVANGVNLSAKSIRLRISAV